MVHKTFIIFRHDPVFVFRRRLTVCDQRRVWGLQGLCAADILSDDGPSIKASSLFAHLPAIVVQGINVSAPFTSLMEFHTNFSLLAGRKKVYAESTTCTGVYPYSWERDTTSHDNPNPSQMCAKQAPQGRERRQAVKKRWKFVLRVDGKSGHPQWRGRHWTTNCFWLTEEVCCLLSASTRLLCLQSCRGRPQLFR